MLFQFAPLIDLAEKRVKLLVAWAPRPEEPLRAAGELSVALVDYPIFVRLLARGEDGEISGDDLHLAERKHFMVDTETGAITPAREPMPQTNPPGTPRRGKKAPSR